MGAYPCPIALTQALKPGSAATTLFILGCLVLFPPSIVLFPPSIAQSWVYMELATNVWKDLKERFSQGVHVCVAELQQEMNSLKQGNMSITDFFTEMKILWEELENYRPLPQSVCVI